MSGSERKILIRLYAAGEISWHELCERGFEDYMQVLGALGELGLRQMTGPNAAEDERGRAMLREARKAHR